jgi:hypothetical protein
MTDSRDDDEFAATADELSTVLEELRDELKREQPRGPFGLPRPPSPGEVLRFADEVAIPGTIAILEVNIKLLETVQRAIRIVDTGRRARDRTEGARGRASESASRLADVSDQTLRRLEDSLSDLQSALDGGGVPEDGAAGELLSEARALRDDVESRLREARDRERDHTLDDFEERADRADESRRADAARDDDPADRREDQGENAVPGSAESGERGVDVDVDAELETLRDRYGNDGDTNGVDGDTSGVDGDASGVDGDASGVDGDASGVDGGSSGEDGGGGDGTDRDGDDADDGTPSGGHDADT